MKVDMSNIVSVADAVKPAIEEFDRIAKEVEVFFNGIREKLDQLQEELCAEHECLLKVNEDLTLQQSWKARSLVVRYFECSECAKEFTQALVNEKFSSMGIPHKLRAATLGNYKIENLSQEKAVKKVAMRMRIGSGFLILRGGVGTGKSHLAAATLKESKSGLFVTQADLIAELRQTYAENTGQEKMVQRYRNAKVLVLDELTEEVKGVDIPALLYRILGDRYDKGRLTVITSNETLETIMTILGARLTDRIREDHTVVTCEWPSHRKQK